jgi:D-amino-acid dehydrogenase
VLGAFTSHHRHDADRTVNAKDAPMKALVLGAGVVGTTTAYFLAKDGHEVEVVDRQEKAAMETSFSNAGMIAPGHSYTWASPRAPKILLQSLFRDDTALKFRLRLDPALWA